MLGHDDGKVSLWSSAGDLVYTWWPHEAPVTRLALRGHGKAPLILSAGDCAAVSQFLPGDKLQEVRIIKKKLLPLASLRSFVLLLPIDLLRLLTLIH